MVEAGVYTARGIHELHQMVANLARDGFRIITVIDTQNGDYHVVAQQEITYEERLEPQNITVLTHAPEGENVKFIQPEVKCPSCLKDMVYNGSKAECRNFLCGNWRGY